LTKFGAADTVFTTGKDGRQGVSMRHVRFVALLMTLVSTMVMAQSIEPHGAVNFDKVNVCPEGQTSPKPCSRTSKVTFDVTATTTFGKTKVVTQGIPNLDFTLSATNCKGTLPAGSSCYVRAKFAPRAPGVRMGAVRLTDSSGNLLTSTYLYGYGQGPVAAFNPGAQRNLPVTGFDEGSLAVDAAGDVYFSDGSSIEKFDIRTGVQTTVASGVPVPYALGLAVDGAGNIFVGGGSVVKIAVDTGVQTTVGKDLNASEGVAVDGRGNLYVGDGWESGQGLQAYPRLAEVFAAGGQETLLGGDDYGFQGMPLLNYPWGVAVDGAGNAYVACVNYGPVYESVAGTPAENGHGIIASRHFTAVGSFSYPSAVAVDAAGDVFVVDGGSDQNGIYEVAASDGSQTLVVNGPGDVPLALDAAGNLFFPAGPIGNATLAEVKGSRPATLDFGKIVVGSSSAPQSVTIQNIGNQPLNAVAPGLIVGTNFLQVPGSGTPADCTSSFSLVPGATCNLSIVFAPQVVGTIKGTATFTDNALNTIPSANQSVKLRGIGVQ
jgi:sugar lactone lactonase YvrE